MSARLRTVPPVAVATQVAAPPVPEDGAPYVQPADLEECAGLVLGSPTRFGNMAAPVKHFIDGLGAQWASGTLVGKPARSEEHTSDLQSLMRISYAVFCLKKKMNTSNNYHTTIH